MPFMDMPERGLRAYYTTNPTWPYSPPSDLKFGRAAQSNSLDPLKENLVFVHPSSSSLTVFSEQFTDPRFTKRFNMIAMDARIHGWTTGAQMDQPYGLEDAADDILAVLDRLDLGSYSVLGESFFGAHVGTWIAIKRPEQIRALVLVSPGWMSELEGVHDEMRDNWFKPAMGNKNGQGDATGLIPPAMVEVCLDYFFLKHDRNFERQACWATAFQARYGPGFSPHDLNHILYWFKRKEIPKELRAGIRVPVLILAGEQDQTFPIAAAKEWREGFTSARGSADLQIISSAPHLVMYTSPSVANRIVLSFLGRYLTPPESRPISAFLPEETNPLVPVLSTTSTE